MESLGYMCIYPLPQASQIYLISHLLVFTIYQELKHAILDWTINCFGAGTVVELYFTIVYEMILKLQLVYLYLGSFLLITGWINIFDKVRWLRCL